MSAEYVGVPRSTGEFILRDVTVVDVADGNRSGGPDVRISGGTITEIGAVGQNAAGVTVVDGGGAFVVPGYVDSHAHALNDPGRVAGAYALMLANGITGFRQMSGSPKLLKDRRAGRLPAPPGAPALLATPGTLLTPLNSATPADAAAEVRAQHEQGADFIKAGMTSHDSFLAALAEAARVVTQKPATTPLERLTGLIHVQIEAAVRMRDYLFIYFDRSRIPDTAYDEWRRWADSYEHIWINTVANAIAAGDLPPGDVRLTTRLLLGMTIWVANWYRPKDGITTEQIQARALEVLGLARAQPAAAP